MMKKSKYQQQNFEIECEKYRAQNKFLFSKIKNMHEKEQKKAHCDYSISFDLSRDEDSRML